MPNKKLNEQKSSHSVQDPDSGFVDAFAVVDNIKNKGKTVNFAPPSLEEREFLKTKRKERREIKKEQKELRKTKVAKNFLKINHSSQKVDKDYQKLLQESEQISESQFSDWSDEEEYSESTLDNARYFAAFLNEEHLTIRLANRAKIKNFLQNKIECEFFAQSLQCLPRDCEISEESCHSFVKCFFENIEYSQENFFSTLEEKVNS